MQIELNRVKKKYDGFQLDCTMKLGSGCVTGLIGRNGAGKSTIFKAILGLISVDEGSITIDGKKPQHLTKKDKEKFGVVLADSGFSGQLMVSEITQIMNAMYKHFDKEIFSEKCKEFAIPMDKKVSEFSTGMKVKLKVLLAMSHQAKVLILDEPTAGLDVVARDEILGMLQEYMEHEERSILISSHISSDLEGFCDDVYMIEDGEIILHEDTDVLLDSYGILKITEEQYQELDKQYIQYVKQEKFGYQCLTNEKQYYLENYPEIVVEKSGIDGVIGLIIKGKKQEV